MIFTRRFRRLHLEVTIPVAEKRHLFSPLQYIISFIFKPNPLFHITTGPVCRNSETLSRLIGFTEAGLKDIYKSRGNLSAPILRIFSSYWGEQRIENFSYTSHFDSRSTMYRVEFRKDELNEFLVYYLTRSNKIYLYCYFRFVITKII